jgi:ribonuclease Z
LQLVVEGIRIDVRSLGGIATTIAFPEWSLCIDLGVVTQAALRCDTVAFTHAHADHVSGLNQFLGVRRLYGMRPPRLITSAAIAGPMQRLVDAMGELQGRPFESVVEGVEPDGEIEVGRGLRLRPFPVVHQEHAVGWSLVRRVQKLRPAYVGLPGPEIARLKADDSVELFDPIDDPLIAVTGDTQAEGLDLSHPWVRRARVLMIETTFLDDERRDSNAAKVGKHVHLDDLPAILAGVEARAVVLYHVSQVYRPAEVESAIRGRIPEAWRNRVHVVVPGDDERL